MTSALGKGGKPVPTGAPGGPTPERCSTMYVHTWFGLWQIKGGYRALFACEGCSRFYRHDELHICAAMLRARVKKSYREAA